MSTTVNTFAELTDNGSTAAFALPGSVCDVDVYIADAETYDSGSITAECSNDGGTTWVTQTGLSAITSGDGYIASFRAYGPSLRFTVASVATASASLTLTVKCTPVVSSAEHYNITANGNTAVVLSRPGPCFIYVNGTFDSASLTLSQSPDGTLYVDTGLTAITAAGGALFANAPADETLRIVTASIVTASDLDVTVYQTHE